MAAIYANSNISLLEKLNLLPLEFLEDITYLNIS